MSHTALRSTVAALAFTVVLSGFLAGCATDGTKSSALGQNASPATAASDSSGRRLPALVVTNDPPPDVIYRRGSRDTVLASEDGARSSLGSENPHVETLVTRKVSELGADLTQEQRAVEDFQDRLTAIQSKTDGLASEYYSLVAAIETELQSGTTAGNPVLTDRWNKAQEKLDMIEEASARLNELATDISNEASKAAYLQDSVRSTYSLSGAVEDDHKKLQRLEDAVNQNIVAINRLLTSTSDEINRRTSYMRSERLNMQTLSLAIANGELYGQNIATALFKKAAEEGQPLFGADDSSAEKTAAMPTRRPLVIIRFDRPDVEYQQAVYTAVSQVLNKRPSAKFDLVAVSPTEGNPAELALASTEARKNGEGVLRSLTQMGLPVERVRMNAANSRDVANNEVHLYIQ